MLPPNSFEFRSLVGHLYNPVVFLVLEQISMILSKQGLARAHKPSSSTQGEKQCTIMELHGTMMGAWQTKEVPPWANIVDSTAVYNIGGHGKHCRLTGLNVLNAYSSLIIKGII